MNIDISIEDLNLYGSSLCVDFTHIAAERGFLEKDYQNIRFKQRSVLPSFEDPITLAANAARPILEKSNSEDFELLIVATETGVDYAKPISSYLHRHLGLGEHCRNFEMKHACYAGTASLQMASSWMRSRISPGKKALVVMTDIGRAHFGELAELSIGAGAIALSLTTGPGIVKLEPYSGYGSQEVYDTARPTSSFERIDRVLSLGAFLDLLEISWIKYQDSVGEELKLEEYFSYMLYHTPLMSLIEQAHELLLRESDFRISKEAVADSFSRMVMPSLDYNLQLGNIYSGSMYAALIGLLDKNVPVGSRIGCYSYGSGACAEVFSMVVEANAHAIISSRQIGQHLAARCPITVKEYENALKIGEESMTARYFTPNQDMFPDLYETAYHGQKRLVLEKVEDYYRHYRWS